MPKVSASFPCYDENMREIILVGGKECSVKNNRASDWIEISYDKDERDLGHNTGR